MENQNWKDYLGSYNPPLSLSLYAVMHNDGMPRQNTLPAMSAKNTCFDSRRCFLSLGVKFMLSFLPRVITEYPQNWNDLLTNKKRPLRLNAKMSNMSLIFDIWFRGLAKHPPPNNFRFIHRLLLESLLVCMWEWMLNQVLLEFLQLVRRFLGQLE